MTRALVCVLAFLASACVGAGMSRTPELAPQGTTRLEVQATGLTTDLPELQGVWAPQARLGAAHGLDADTELLLSASIEPVQTFAWGVELGARRRLLFGEGWNLNAGVMLGGHFGTYAGAQARALYAHAPLVLGLRLTPGLWLAPSLGLGTQWIEARAAAPLLTLAADAGTGLLWQPLPWFALWGEARKMWSSARTEGRSGTKVTHVSVGPVFWF